MCLAVPGKILRVRGDDPLTRMGSVSFGGVVRDVSLAFAPEAIPGDFVLVHVGFAIARIDEEEARRVFDYVRRIGDLEAAEAAG